MLPVNSPFDGDQLVVSGTFKAGGNQDGRSVGRRSHSRLHDRRAGPLGGAAAGRSRGGRHQDRAAGRRHDAPARAGPQSRHGRLLPRLQSLQAFDRSRPQAGVRAQGAVQARRDRRRGDAQLSPRSRQAAGRRVRGVREDQSAPRLSRDLRLPRRRTDGREGGLRRHHPGRFRPGRSADRRGGRAALPADHRGRQDQLERRRLGAAGGPVRARAYRQGPGGRGADVRDAGLLRDGRASLWRDLQAGARHGGLQARAQQGAPPLSVEGRLLRAAALHRQSLA